MTTFILPHPSGQPRFAIGDRVVVVRPGADSGLVGIIVRVLPRSRTYLVEFNRVDQQLYAEADLALAPEPIAA